MRHSLFALSLLAGTALAAPAFAQAPAASPAAAAVPAKPRDPNLPMADLEDRNMRSQEYRAGVRTQLVVPVGRSSMLTFGGNEQIIHVVIGDGGKTVSGPGGGAQGGQGGGATQPLRNNLPLWGEAPGITTLQVITQVAGGAEQDRVYQFAVQTRLLPPECVTEPTCGDADKDFTYGLIFRYPEDERRKREAAAAAARQAARDRAAAAAPAREEARRLRVREVAVARLAVDYFGAGERCRNWLYEGEANEAGLAFVPEKVADNGQETAFLYSGDRPLPAFFTLNPDGTEAPIFPIMKGQGVAVLPTTAKEIHLRAGNAVVHIYNRNPEFGRNCDPGTGTTSPDVIRVVRRPRRVA